MKALRVNDVGRCVECVECVVCVLGVTSGGGRSQSCGCCSVSRPSAQSVDPGGGRRSSHVMFFFFFFFISRRRPSAAASPWWWCSTASWPTATGCWWRASTSTTCWSSPCSPRGTTSRSTCASAGVSANQMCGKSRGNRVGADKCERLLCNLGRSLVSSQVPR